MEETMAEGKVKAEGNGHQLTEDRVQSETEATKGTGQ